MTDLFIAYRRADKERVDIIRQSLLALGLTIAADIEPKGRGAAKAIRDAAAAARVVLTLWPAEILDPTQNHAGLYGLARTAHVDGRLVAARLAPLAVDQLEPPFDSLPTPDLSAWLSGETRPAGAPEWQSLLVAIGRILGRPVLGELAIAVAADGAGTGAAQLAFARRHGEDAASAAIWERFETAERARFADAFRKAHGVLMERHQGAQDRLKASLEAFPAYLQAARKDAALQPPDPREAIADGATALRDSVARLAADNERLQTALDRARVTPPPAAANGNRPWAWIGMTAAAFVVGSLGAATLTEFVGPFRGDAHPRIAGLARAATERAETAAQASAELARLREQARAAARRAETAEANLRNARTQLAHSQTELIQRQTQASEATGSTRRLQGELQTAQQALASAERKAQEAATRVAGLEQEVLALRETATAAADAAVTTGSVRPRPAVGTAEPQPAPAAASQPQSATPSAAPLPPTRPEGEVTGSVPPAPPPAVDGPYRHRRDRWSFAIPPGFRLDSDNDLPGPVNSVLVHEQNRDAVVVVSANAARGACTPQAWYWDNIVEGSRPRRGEVTGDAALPQGEARFRGFTVRGRGVLQADRFRTDLEYYDLVAQRRSEPGVVYLVQARFPRAMAGEMIRSVNALWKDFEVTGPRAYPTRC
ncbi:hypothetical protein [Phreatobacter sp.]|uniref:hypothetical protein n=1 Tax=Phreatobacter sp. TaxID=1966341 RepID=UPI0022CA4C2B|nr:hypothetical protein [Phreatobacter sp.]MCZ8317095.1 hypothetical protein [Phreatobacter sp.]